MARQPRIPMKSEIEQALLVLEHTERSTLVDCGADKRIRQLFKTTSTRRKAQDFDKSEMSPTKLAKLSHNQGRSALLGAEFCTDLVLETCDVEAAGALASTCGLARVRCEPKLKAWKTLRRKIQNADLGTIETILDKYVTSPRTMCWTLSRLSAMGGEGVAYEHGRRLKVSEAKGLTPKHVTEITKKLRAAEKSEKPLYGPNEHIGCPPKLARYAANHFSVKHVRAERPDVHGWTRHAGSKYWLGVWKLLANSAVSRNKTNGGRYVLERFVFPARSEEWVAVAEVRVAKRFYSHRLELVAQLEQTGPTHYLKVKPSLKRACRRHDRSETSNVRAVRRGAGLGGRDLRGAGGEHGQPLTCPCPKISTVVFRGDGVGVACLRCGAAACRLLRSIGPRVSSCLLRGTFEAATGSLGFVDLSWRPVLRETARGALLCSALCMP